MLFMYLKWPTKSGILVRPNPFFCSTQFSGSNRLGWPSGSKNRSYRVGLTWKRVQIRVQPYNLIWTRLVNRVESGWVGPQGQNLGQIWVRLVGFIWPQSKYRLFWMRVWYYLVKKFKMQHWLFVWFSFFV